MSLPHFIMWAVVLAVAAPASFRNPTAGALALCYLFSETLLIADGGMPLDYYFILDVAVIAVIVAKPERYPCAYRNGWHQLACFLLERSWADRFILLSYPFVWWCYAAALQPATKWWLLWAAAIAQFLAAGAEALFDHNRRRGADAAFQPDPGAMLVAYPGGGYG